MRTTEADVKERLGPNWNRRDKVTRPLKMANTLVTRLITYGATLDPAVAVDDETAEVLEVDLAAHFYQVMDRGYSSRSTDGASGSFDGKTEMYLDATLYGQTAKMLDPTGLLNDMNNEAKASIRVVDVGGVWLGTPASQQPDYEDRR